MTATTLNPPGTGAVRSALVEPAHLLVAVRGIVDSGIVDHIEGAVAGVTARVRDLSLHFGGATAIDPVAAARLWLLCQEAAARRGWGVQIVGVAESLARALRNHPLRDFLDIDDLLFTDPFRRGAPSGR